MNNKQNTNETLSRMKTLMSYGLNENKKAQYSSVEYQKLGADGNSYAIIREGTSYFIKKAPNKPNLVKENYDYIGGFRNRKDYQYSSFADAQKNFDLKMISLKEAANNDKFNIESWDLDKKEKVVMEASDKMQKEILRERQIMKNTLAINEKKAVCCDEPKCPKDNIKSEKPETGDAKNAVDHEKAELPKEMTEDKVCPKCGKNPCKCDSVNEEEVLGWNRGNDDYMDKSHGTVIGSSAPFDDAKARDIDDGDKKVTKTSEMNNGVVENHNKSMHDADSQDTPTAGVGEGPSDDNNKPFDDEKGKQIDEAIDDFGDEPMDDEPMNDEGDVTDDGDDVMDDEPMDDELASGDDDEIVDDDEIDLDDEDNSDDNDDVYKDDLESRISSMEELLDKIAAKLGVSDAGIDDASYGDDELYDDGDDETEFEFDVTDDNDDDDDDIPMEGVNRRGTRIYETSGYRNAVRKMRMNEEGMKPFTDANRVPSGNMNKLDDFGKHPAYQKKVMTLPPKDHQEFEGYYDMNDDSVKSDEPYGRKIGSGAPFEINPETIDNAIAEAFNRLMNKKKA